MKERAVLHLSAMNADRAVTQALGCGPSFNRTITYYARHVNMTHLQYFIGQQGAEHNGLVKHGLLNRTDRSVEE
jgi:hypothetical protein